MSQILYVFVVSRVTTIKIEVIVTTNISHLAISSFVDKDIIALARAENLIKGLRAIQSRLWKFGATQETKSSWWMGT